VAPVEIPRSRTKAFGLLVASAGFVALGSWMLRANETYRGVPAPLIGVAAMVFGGAALFFGVRWLRDRSPGMILDDDGFDDRSSAVAVGRVPWRDVQDVQTMTIAGQRFIVVRVHEPAPYIERGTWIQRSTRRANARRCGSPITITVGMLGIGCDELVAEMQRRATLG